MVLECCVSAGNRRKMLGKSYLWLSTIKRYKKTHGSSTLGNWRTCKCMRTFPHYCKFFCTKNQDCNVICKQTSSPASFLVPHIEICEINVSNACNRVLKLKLWPQNNVLIHISAISQKLDLIITNPLFMPSQIMFFKP